MRPEERSAIIVTVGSVLIAIAFVAMDVYEGHQRRQLPYYDTDTRVGRVVAVENCQANKHSTYCDVTLDGNRTFETDITNYPGDNLQVGQEIWQRVRRQGDLKTTYRITPGHRDMIIMRRERLP